MLKAGYWANLNRACKKLIYEKLIAINWSNQFIATVLAIDWLPPQLIKIFLNKKSFLTFFQIVLYH